MAATVQGKPKSAWSSLYLVPAYRYARAGLNNTQIAQALEIPRNTFDRWVKSREDLKQALAEGRQEVPDEDSYVRYFYEQLDGRLKELWDRLVTNEMLGGGVSQMRLILADHGTSARQALFLHALVSSHFNPSAAMEKVGLDKRTLDNWINTDPDFAELVEQVQWHKGNFFEQRLIQLCESGDKGAIFFANRTFNARRGYGNSVQVSGTVKHEHEHKLVIDLDELELDFETRSKILEAHRRMQDKKAEQRYLLSRPVEERAAVMIESQISDAAELLPEV